MPRWIGPFKVIRAVNAVALQLQLPAGYRIHNVFHVSLLKLAKGKAVSVHPGPELFVDGQAYWTVDTFVGHRTRKQGKKTFREFLVRWDGYGPEDDTWEPEDALRESQPLEEEIERYLGRLNQNTKAAKPQTSKPHTRARATASALCCHMDASTTFPFACMACMGCADCGRREIKRR